MSRMSYVHVPHTCPMEARPLHSYLDSMAEQRPENEALIMYDMQMTRCTMTFKEFSDWSMFLASSLLDLGFSRDHHVLLIGASSIRYAVSLMALHRIGANAILLGPGGMTDDKIELLKTLNLTSIICDPAMKDSQIDQLRRGIRRLSRSQESSDKDQEKLLFLMLGDHTSNKRVTQEEAYSYEGLIERGKTLGMERLAYVQSQICMEERSAAFFTSGSTGSPKLTQYTMHPQTTNINAIVALTGEGPTNLDGSAVKEYIDRPMAWNGGYNALTYGILAGTSIVWLQTEMALSEGRNKEIFKIIEKEKCIHAAFSVALIHKLVSDRLHLKYDLTCLKLFGLAGQRFPTTMVKSVLNCLPHARALLGYGSTEGGIHAYMIYTKESITEEEYGKMFLVPGQEVRIVDDNNKIVPRGTEGEICFRSQYQMMEYLGNHTVTMATRSPTRWLHMGDIGRMDENGRIEVLGRTKEIIKRATVKIFPAEIEGPILGHPVVADVVVVGVPDQRLHEEICACVILKDESSDIEARLAELEAWCAQQWPPGADGLSLKPKYFVPMKSFPSRTTGKVDRNGVRRDAENYLGLWP